MVIENTILDALIGKTSDTCRDYFAELLEAGKLDDATVKIKVKPETKPVNQGALQQVLLNMKLRKPHYVYMF